MNSKDKAMLVLLAIAAACLLYSLWGCQQDQSENVEPFVPVEVEPDVSLLVNPFSEPDDLNPKWLKVFRSEMAPTSANPEDIYLESYAEPMVSLNAARRVWIIRFRNPAAPAPLKKAPAAFKK